MGAYLDGAVTLDGAMFQWTFAIRPLRHRYNAEAFKDELLPLHSPLLRQSLLVSFPPLIDMLKFSG